MKKAISILTVLVLCLSINLCAAASSDSPRLFDNATLLSSEEADELLAKLDEVSENHDVDIVVVTVNSTGDKSTQDYAADYYDYNGFSETGGALFLLSMSDRQWFIVTTGTGIQAITDAGREAMSEKFLPYLSDGEYFDGFMTFADLCDNYFAKYETDGKGYDVDDLPKDDFDVTFNLLICLGIGFVIGLITVLVMKGKLKSVAMQNYAGDYVVNGSMHINGQSDTFLYANVVSTPRANDNDSSGGSSTFTGSSGTSHGGGGGSF